MKLLLKKIAFTAMMVAILEIGSDILLPGFPARDYVHSIGQNAYINLVSSNFGSQITVPSLFALGMGPYMTALIVWQTITITSEDTFKRLSPKATGFWQKLLTLILSILQAIATAWLFMKYQPNRHGYSWLAFYFVILMILIAGSMFIVWLADLNAKWGVGGTSILIIPALVKNLPTVLNSGLKQPIEFDFQVSTVMVLLMIVFFLMSVYTNQAEVRFKIERVSISSRLTDSYIPIRLLASGAMPFMFAMTLYSIPSLLLSRSKLSGTEYAFLAHAFSYHTWQGILTYSAVIVFLGYGFAFVNVRPHSIAKSLQKSGDYILNVAPGKDTETYLTNHLYRIIFIGNCFLLFIAVTPLFLGLYVPQLTNFSFLFGSLLILITMLDNVIQEVHALFVKNQYSIF